MQRELSFREIRLSSLVQQCAISVILDTQKLVEIQERVYDRRVKFHVARKKSDAIIRRITVMLTRGDKCLKELRRSYEEETAAEKLFLKGLGAYSKISPWFH